MAKLFLKIKSAFSRSNGREQNSTKTSASSSSESYEQAETAAPSYYHAAAAQPPAYQPLASQPQRPASSHSETPPTTFQQQAREIAKIQVGGMRRTAGAGGASSHLSSYAPSQPTGPPSSILEQRTVHTTHSSYASGSDEKKDLQFDANGAAKATDQGKPNGTTYDHRQKLSEEDEDMWARLAM
ncbi:hypothetical protein VPNG_10313 [Cytospora leucostoma]|uniref:Uncharacterized protein n=1 Tax=Cytospora leucostoma TaxID=1230097 RepID=A0A423VCV6_9PEZI|nr:hypothetical protein VPNG_10313 [Cytospora leucostoma]